MTSRAADPSEAAEVARTVAFAFADDPVWSVALRPSDGRTPDLEPYWRLFVDGALRFGTVRTIDDGAAVSVWLPPGAAELDDAGLAALEGWIDRELDDVARSGLHTLYARFEASRARRPDHYYLSLLATHPDHRGRGVGQALLSDDLALWDAGGIPSYLESTNAANDHRYARAGFRADGGFRAVRDDTWITAMWRPVGGAEQS